jgi:hypothetical protein
MKRRPLRARDDDDRPRPKARPRLERDTDDVTDDDERHRMKRSAKPRKKDNAALGKIAGILTGGLVALGVVVVIGLKVLKVGVVANKIDRIVNKDSNDGGNTVNAAPINVPPAAWINFNVGTLTGQCPGAMTVDGDLTRKLVKPGESGQVLSCKHGAYKYFAGYVLVPGGVSQDAGQQRSALSLVANAMIQGFGGRLGSADTPVNGRPGTTLSANLNGVAIVIRITFATDRLLIYGCEARNANTQDANITRFVDSIISN